MVNLYTILIGQTYGLEMLSIVQDNFIGDETITKLGQMIVG